MISIASMSGMSKAFAVMAKYKTVSNEPMILASMVAVISLTFAKKIAIYADIYDMQLHFKKCTGASNNWMAGHIWSAGRCLDNTGLCAYCHIPYTVLCLLHTRI